VPEIHVHAFSPLEVTHGAKTLGISTREFLQGTQGHRTGLFAGHGCRDSRRRDPAHDRAGQTHHFAWMDVLTEAHRCGLPTTSTIMFGHVEHYKHWARHLLRLRELQRETGGITEFVPLPFVHMEAPSFCGQCAQRTDIARSHPDACHFPTRALSGHRQYSGVVGKIGPGLGSALPTAGANDLGGTLMNESISRAAGSTHGQELLR